ncbi:MAG: hypothetical protein FJZ43_05155 [Candidatus Staskawiczbacteria bacterium]|nr:hypothetical protein [Candidatus Staskawiczbacteria bacterium]
MAYITPDSWLRLNYFKKLRKYIIDNFNLFKLSESLYKVFESVTVDTIVFFISRNISANDIILVRNKLSNENKVEKRIGVEYEIITDDENAIVRKLDNIDSKLSAVCDVTQGLIAYHSKGQKRIWTSMTMETKFHRKILFGGDIGKYYLKWSGEYLKYGKWLHRKRPDYVFNNDKILIQRIRNPKLPDRIIATYDNEKFINSNGLSNILLLDDPIFKVDLKFILGILNSKLINYWFGNHYKDVNIKPEQLRRIPIKEASLSIQAVMVQKVDSILKITKKDDYLKNSEKQAKVHDLELQIDELVYKLYELTPEEREIVENSSKKND